MVRPYDTFCFRDQNTHGDQIHYSVSSDHMGYIICFSALCFSELITFLLLTCLPLYMCYHCCHLAVSAHEGIHLPSCLFSMLSQDKKNPIVHLKNNFTFYCSHFFLCLIVVLYMILTKAFIVMKKMMMLFFQTHKYKSTKIQIPIGK